MCGIIGCISRRNVRDLLLEGLRRLEYRGYDSAGVAIIEEDASKGQYKMHHHRVCGKVEVLSKELNKHHPEGHLGIAHTRWATHGKVTVNNAHPHLIDNKLALVHNGIIENYLSLREKLIEKGYAFQSETDSEVVAALIHDHLQRDKDLVAAISSAVKKLEGAFSLAVIHLEQPNLLLGVRKGSPLVVGVGTEENFLASDPIALLQATDRFIYLEENEIAILHCEEYEIRKIGGKKVKRKIEVYEHGHAAIDPGDYGHFMLKEIYEQPETVINTLTGRMTKRSFLPQTLGERGMQVLPQVKALYLVGCGTAYHAGMVARYWFEEYSDLLVKLDVASEFRYMEKNIALDSLYVTISQSGETADVLAALQNASKAKGNSHQNFLASLAICNIPSSTLVRACDIPLLIAAGPEIGVASTKAFTAQLVGLLILLGFFLQIKGDQKAVMRLIAALESLPALIEKTLALRPQIAQAVELLADKNSVLFIGRGPLMPLAMEGALKLKEISYIHAEAYPGGELKHGPLALVDEKTPTVVLTGSGIHADKIKSNMQEIAARRGPLLVFAENEDKETERLAENLIVLPHAKIKGGEIIAPILYGIATQLLAYEVALRLGTDIDKPRNLAKSVTVE